MTTKIVLVVLFLLSLGVIGRTLAGRGAEVQAEQSMTVLVASGPLPPGSVLRGQDVRWRRWTARPDATLIVEPDSLERASGPEAADALASVYGSVLIQPIEAGQVIPTTALVGPHDRSFLQRALAPGARAIAVDVTPDTGAAGRIYPGDRVDLLLTQSFKGSDEAAAHRSVSETVVENLRVLTIDARPTAPAMETFEAPKTVTLEVAPKQAEAVSVAKELGRLSLVLRAVGADQAGGGGSTHPTWADDVSAALRAPKAPVIEKSNLRIMRGSASQDLKRE